MFPEEEGGGGAGVGGEGEGDGGEGRGDGAGEREGEGELAKAQTRHPEYGEAEINGALNSGTLLEFLISNFCVTLGVAFVFCGF